MSLSEGKMFTIEALNRIEGFVWPHSAAFACMDSAPRLSVDFYHAKPELADGKKSFGCKFWVDEYSCEFNSETEHPDWRNSLITREEFESVDGWVRNTGKSMPEQADEKRIDYIMRSGHSFVNCRANDLDWAVTNRQDDIIKWRHHKPQKQEVKPEPESNGSDQPSSQEGIESLISKHKAVKEISRLARIELERVEAAEHSLMLSIEAWAESHGFDIRVLSESDNVIVTDGLLSSPEYSVGYQIPEPVITDWRDLKIDDVVSWSVVGYRGEFTVNDIYRDNEGGNPCAAITAPNGKQYNVYADELKFIRRPEKK
ncbi:MAG: hypothetical protein ACRC8W_01120 [Plesiomonas shigelloides]